MVSEQKGSRCQTLSFSFFFFFFNANAASIGSLLKLFRPEEQKDLDLSKPREIVVEVNPSLNCSPEQGTMHIMKKVSKTLPIIIHKLIILKNLKEILTD